MITQQSFLTRMSIDVDTGCWNWRQSTANNGYGQTFFQGKVSLAHRVSHLLYKGAIPKNYQIDHLCKNKVCVNPQHLEAVTQQENISRQSFPRRRMTHCKRGHEFSENNIYRTTTGRRQCRKCITLRWRNNRYGESF